MCWCQLISPSITGLRHYRSGCALLLGARSAHERRDEAHDPRQSWSDTSPPISQAVPGLQSGSDDTHFVLPSSRQPKPGTKLSRLNLSAPKTGKLSLHAQNSPNSTLLDEQGNFVTDITRGSSTGHVLSDHKLYARTLTRWLTRPPATPSMGGRHTRGQRGLAAVPVGGGGASIPKQLHLLSTPGPSRSRLCSGRRMACPPARRPRRELRSARRLEARPGPAGPAASSTRATPAQYVVVVRPCLPCSASVYITRPRPVSRPRPRR